MNVLGLVFGFAAARGLPDASRIALVGALPRSPVLGLVLASSLASRERNDTSLAAAGTDQTIKRGPKGFEGKRDHKQEKGAA
jgi:hypothetical protein